MGKWRVWALDTGTSVIEKSIITYLTDCGQSIRIPRIMYYLEGEKRIIVDTSGESVDVARQLGEHMSRSPEQEPLRALAQLGVKPEDIDIVINTHLHWDHCGNNRLFPNAEVIVQKRELRYALAPPKPLQKAYLSPLAGYRPPYLGGNIVTVDGDVELFDGLTLILTPGHSIGHQSLLVETAGGTLCLAQDAIFTYENLEKEIPPGFHWRIEEAMDSMHRIRRMARWIVPGHDYRIFEEGIDCPGFQAVSPVASNHEMGREPA